MTSQPGALDSRRWSTRQLLNERRATAAYAAGEGYARHRPVEIYLQIASGCNLDCYMCSEHLRPEGTKRGRGLVSMAPELYARLAEEVFPYAMRVTFGVGGEPTLSPNFVEFVTTAHARGLDVHVTTNGTRIVDDTLAEVLARCTHRLDISLDAVDASTYERIRRGARHGQMRANLARLSRQRARIPEGERGILRLAFVLMRSNVHELPDFVRLAAEVGADGVQAQHVIPVTEGGRAEVLFEDQERCDHYLRRAAEVGAELGVTLDLPSPWSAADPPGYTPPPPPPVPPIANGPTDGAAGATPAAAPLPAAVPPQPGPSGGDRKRLEPAPIERLPRASRIPCHLATRVIYVFYDGRVFPCCHPYAHQQMRMGDLRAQGFEEIWNGRAWRNLRVALAAGAAPPICRSCSVVQSPPPEREDPAAVLDPDHAIGCVYGDQDLAPPPRRGPGEWISGCIERTVPLADHLSGRAVAARRIDKLTRLARGESLRAPSRP